MDQGISQLEWVSSFELLKIHRKFSKVKCENNKERNVLNSPSAVLLRFDPLC